jgi:ketosteroid isomerase-like protein
MVTVREAVERGDLAAFREVLSPDVVWIGLWPGELCRNREQVLNMLERGRANGRVFAPEIVREDDDKLIVDPHLADSERHQIFVLQDGLVAEIRAYPNRDAALAAMETPW